MISWAQKYRPKTLNEYLGDGVVSLVKNRFSSDTLPNVILIAGSKGCGKTTLAWLLTKEYNCLDKTTEGVCNKCVFCQDVNARIDAAEVGVEVYGVQEIDIAAEGRRANIDSILEEAVLAPHYPIKYKILIMDEFHMANRSVQNRLLKIMEEPPSHLVFILCTTNPEEIIPTILSRCQVRINVTKADKGALVKRLDYVARQEGLQVSKEALALIASQTDRTPREALMLLEGIARSSNNKVTLETVYAYLDDTADDSCMRFFQYASMDKPTAVMKLVALIHELKAKDTDLTQYANKLTKHLLDCIYIKYGYSIEDHSKDFLKSVKAIFGSYTHTQIEGILLLMQDMLSKINSTGNAELHLINLGLRISGVNSVADIVTDRTRQAELESKAGLKKYASEHKLGTSDKQEAQSLGSMINSTHNSTSKVGDLKEVSGSVKVDTADKEALPLDETDILDFFTGAYNF